MTDLKIRGSYYWSDGSPVKYTNWFNGQPDDAARRGSCVKTSLHRGYRDMLSLVDDDCASKNAFICKKLKGLLVLMFLELHDLSCMDLNFTDS